jgi:hypothetical protein
MRELAGEENGIAGNNIYSDCWAQEHMTHTSYAEPSGDACDNIYNCNNSKL